MNERQLFQKFLAPTSHEPMAIAVQKAYGTSMWGEDGMEYLDLASGASVANVGHCHPQVVKAIQEQTEKYLHVMVYGEFIQSPQVQYAQLLCQHLPEALNCVYFTNSGSEAVEGAMKLAKRFTGRSDIVACHNSYHGSTQGSLSLLGDEYWRRAYRPLLPGIRHVRHNNLDDLQYITGKTACIILEPIQAEAGVLIPDKFWMQALRKRCDETGALLIFDEIQTGFGRTGKLWAFEHFDIWPDVLILAKAMGGGMPLGSFISSPELIDVLAFDPILGHITTFGGHPVCCAAGKAGLEVVLEDKLADSAESKGKLFKKLLKHPAIKAVRGQGLLIAVEFQDFETMQKLFRLLLSERPKAIFTDWYLFAENCIRVTPPLIISEDEIKWACKILLRCCDRL